MPFYTVVVFLTLPAGMSAVRVSRRVLIRKCSPGPHYYQHPCVGSIPCLLFLA